MMHPRWLALPLAALTGCATAAPARLLSTDLHVGSLDQRTSFELDQRDSGRGSARADERDAPDDDAREKRREADTEKKQRLRRALYWTGIGAFGFGAIGTVGFGAGGRIVQAQLKNGYEDSDLTRDREDQLTTTGQVMNGLAIGSAVVGLLGIAIAATAYGIDHARCGELRPRRKQCAEDAKGSGSTTKDPAGITADEAAAEVGPTEATGTGPDGATPGPGSTQAPGGTQAPGTPAPKSPGSTTSPGTSPSTPTTSNPSPGAKPSGPGSSPGTATGTPPAAPG